MYFTFDFLISFHLTVFIIIISMIWLCLWWAIQFAYPAKYHRNIQSCMSVQSESSCLSQSINVIVLFDSFGISIVFYSYFSIRKLKRYHAWVSIKHNVCVFNHRMYLKKKQMEGEVRSFCICLLKLVALCWFWFKI